jgi:hypothetical protein
MSSGCGDVLSLDDLKTAKLQQLFEAEVITGLQGGVSGGAPIDYATNQVTGQVQKTLPAVLRDAGFRPASFNFTTGGTLTVNDADKAVLWPIASGGDGNYYIWKGALPKVIPASSTPAGTGGVSSSAWVPMGDVTLRTDLAGAGIGQGDALISVNQPLIGAVSRNQHLKNIDVISVLDFGADPTGTNPSTTAFQAALDACSDKTNAFGYGRALRIPGGKYKIDGALVYNWRASDGSVGDGDTRRLTIVGDGNSCTFLNDVRVAPGTTPLITFDGGLTDPHLRISLYGFRVQRPSYDRLGWGLYFKNISIMDMVNVDSQWFINGAVFHDVIQCKIDHCQFGANVTGMIAAKLTWTHPNVFDLQHVMFGGNSEGCINVTSASNFSIDTCTFEGTGSSNAGAQRTIQYTGAPEEGGIGLTVKNCYFENNFVFADIAIESNSTTTIGTHIIEGNTFQRTSPTRYCKGHVNLSPNNSGGKQRFHLRGNTYKFLGGYTHNSGDFSVAIQSDWAEVKDEGNLYNSAQPPVYATRVVDGYDNKIVATAKISASGLLISSGYNVSSVTRPSTGVYRINFKKPLTSSTVIPVATTESGIGSCSITGYDGTYVQVTVNDNTWTVSNSINFNVICIGILL